jgi:hypothetical protein
MNQVECGPGAVPGPFAMAEILWCTLKRQDKMQIEALD